MELIKGVLKMKKLLLVAGALFLSSAVSFAGAHWGYTGKGAPQYWGDLSPEYRLCKEGKNQSPVDISEESTVKACLYPIEVNYSKGASYVLNNGHTIKVVVKGKENYVLIDGKKFYLKQFHFHAPSEHTVNGEHYPFEAHFVNVDKEGNIAVLGVFFKVGAPNPEIEKVWYAMPSQVGQKRKLKHTVNIGDLLPDNRDYYRYSGSLTTPPCTEGVRWIVFKEPLEISQEQLDRFQKTLGVKNNRPVQPINARKIMK